MYDALNSAALLRAALGGEPNTKHVSHLPDDEPEPDRAVDPLQGHGNAGHRQTDEDRLLQALCEAVRTPNPLANRRWM